MIKRDIIPLVLSCENCSLCRFLCSIFEIPIDSIRNGTVWPSVEFRVTSYKESPGRIRGELTLKGPGRRFSSPKSASLPLGKSSTYGGSETTLGFLMNSAGI
jgi:hypothetical protein